MSLIVVALNYRTSRCRHLHPTDLERLNYTLSGHFERQGQTRMALKIAGFLAAIERGAHFIFQANPGENKCQEIKIIYGYRVFIFIFCLFFRNLLSS